jgi:hypothetical protein
MLKQNITSLLLCVVMLLTTAPPKVRAQTQVQPAHAGSDQSASAVPVKPKPDLRMVFR